MSEAAFVYEFFDASATCIYVGATRNFGKRVSQHRKTQPWWSDVDESRTVVTFFTSAWDARERERELIETRIPEHNRGGVTSGHIPYPADRPEGAIPVRVRPVLEALDERNAARAKLKAVVLEAATGGASVRELAAFTGLSTNTISRWKRGE